MSISLIIPIKNDHKNFNKLINAIYKQSLLPSEIIIIDSSIDDKIKQILENNDLYNNVRYYKYKNKWIKNHTLNSSLNNKSEWKLNMLWAEKTHFVNDVCKNNYFQPTDYYGWCDIGYFREGACSNFANFDEYLNPNNVKVVFDKNQFALEFYREPLIKNKKDWNSEKHFHHIGIYGYTKELLDSFCNLPISKLENTLKLEQLRALENNMPLMILKYEGKIYRGIDTPEDLLAIKKYLEK